MLSSTIPAHPGGPPTDEPRETMTVFVLHDSDTRCLLVTKDQLLAIVELLNVDLEVMAA